MCDDRNLGLDAELASEVSIEEHLFGEEPYIEVTFVSVDRTSWLVGHCLQVGVGVIQHDAYEQYCNIPFLHQHCAKKEHYTTQLSGEESSHLI